jgi:hypothetical protein
MKKVSLADFATPVVARLPQAPCRCRVDNVKEDHFIFSGENLPEVPPLLVTHDLVMKRTEHHYGDCIRIDQVHFYGSGETHRQLAVLILATVFSGKSQRVMLDLENKHSTIKHLEINHGGFNHADPWDYERKPHRFVYHPTIPQRVPRDWPADDRDLPMFDLDFSQASKHHPINDMDKRDKVEITGEDNGLVLVAELLLNIGLPACDVKASDKEMPPDKSYVLESFPGHHNVRKWSAEALFHLPGTFSWPGEYPTLGS